MLLQTINHNNIPTSLFSVKRPRNKFPWTICTYFLASAFYKHWLYLTKRSVNHRCKTPSWGLFCNWLMCICASWTRRKILHFLCYDPWLFRATHFIYVIFDNNILYAWTLLRPASELDVRQTWRVWRILEMFPFLAPGTLGNSVTKLQLKVLTFRSFNPTTRLTHSPFMAVWRLKFKVNSRNMPDVTSVIYSISQSTVECIINDDKWSLFYFCWGYEVNINWFSVCTVYASLPKLFPRTTTYLGIRYKNGPSPKLSLKLASPHILTKFCIYIFQVCNPWIYISHNQCYI